ncbi:MAG: hypothetical protein P4L51_10530 [Puia sp.]|nr:hypothetical protein [Puia sp.]
MTGPHHIRYLKRQDIDPGKWDDCIDRSSNGGVYAYSFYLDNMAPRWDALVLDDYRAVMPLTWNKKWGIKYLYQPPLTQQLGIFFRDPGTDRWPDKTPGHDDSKNRDEFRAETVHAFLEEAARHFRFAEIFLNYDNAPNARAHPIKNTRIEPRMNYILPLDTPYPRLRERYSPALGKNLAAAAGFPLRYTNDFDPAKAISIYQDRYHKRLSHVKKEDYDRFLKVCLHLQKEGGLLVRAVYEDPGGPPDISPGPHARLLAVTLLLKKKDRLYLMLPATLPEGRSRQANHFLLDQLIREFAGQPLLLDFEGSDIPGIARFYKKFGPTEQPFFFYRFNRLLWPLHLFKKRN